MNLSLLLPKQIDVNFATLMGAFIFFVAMYPSGKFLDDWTNLLFLVFSSVFFVFVAFVRDRAAFKTVIKPRETESLDAIYVGAIIAALSVLSWSFLNAGLWSDAIYHASMSAQLAQLLIFHVEQDAPGAWALLNGLNAAHVVQLFNIVQVAVLFALFFALPRILKSHNILLASIWVVLVLALRASFSTDIGVLANLAEVPVLNFVEDDPHPPLRLLPLTFSSAVFGANPFGYRAATFFAFLGVAIFYFFALKRHCGRNLAALSTLTIGTIPGLLQTASLVEASVWTALGGWIIFFGLAAANRSQEPVNLVPYAFFAAMAAMMRAPAFILIAPLVMMLIFELSRREISKSDLLSFASIGALGMGAALSFMLGGTPAISDNSPLQQVLQALVDGVPSVALVASIGIVPLILIGGALLARGTHGLVLMTTVVGFAVLAVLVFYGPTKPSLWGTPRYQSEIAIPPIVAGVTTLAMNWNYFQADLTFRNHSFFQGNTAQIMVSIPLIFTLAANLFAVANIYQTKATYLPHAMPMQSVAADAPFPIADALEFAFDAGNGNSPYVIDFWYGGYHAVLYGKSLGSFTEFSRTNQRYRYGWQVGHDGLATDRNVEALVVNPIANFGSVDYFDALEWNRTSFFDKSSNYELFVYLRPEGANRYEALKRSMPDPSPLTQELLSKSIADLVDRQDLNCRGFVDGNIELFGAPQPGTRIAGWAWNLDAETSLDQIIAVDEEGTIIGARTSAVDRSDVAQIIPNAEGKSIGFEIDVPDSTSAIQIYGIDRGANSACLLADDWPIGRSPE